MTVNIYDSANQLEKDIRVLPEYTAVKEAFQAVQANEEAFALFEEFRQLQQTIQVTQMQGQEVDEELANKTQAVAQKVQESELISALMTKEQALSVILNDINKVIMQPIQEIYTTEA